MKTAQEYLTGHNIHPSQQRLAIMNFLLNHHTHPTADDIFTALNPEMPTLSKTTIYNTLKLFAENGAIQVVTIEEKNAHFDADTEVHAHFLCQECGQIYDIPLPKKAESETGMFPCNPNLDDFTVQSTQIYHIGICPKCKTLEK